MEDDEITVSVNMAMTLDGKVVLPDRRWHGMTSSEDRARMDFYRLEADALIIGKNSIIHDDPVIIPKRKSGDSRSLPTPIMICRNSLPPADRKFFTQKQVMPVLFINKRLEKDIHSTKRPGSLTGLCEMKILNDEDLTPGRILLQLKNCGISRVLLEGGPTLNYAFFHEDLVDMLYLTITPFLIGQRNLENIIDGENQIPDFKNRNWILNRIEQIGNEVFLQYQRIRNNSDARGR